MKGHKSYSLKKDLWPFITGTSNCWTEQSVYVFKELALHISTHQSPHTQSFDFLKAWEW